MSLIPLSQSMSLLTQEVACPVVHRFGPGVYMREVSMPAGALVIGRRHRGEHLNLMLSGILDLVDEAGNVIRTVVAPQTFTAPAGRKIARIVDDTVWLNIYATDERDIDKLEALLFDDDEVDARQADVQALHRELRQPERDDYAAFCAAYEGATGVDGAGIREASERTDDIADFPPADAVRVTVRSSPIEGRGLFLTAPAAAGDVLCAARLDGRRTPAGRYTNHSHNPNAAFALLDNGDMDLVALRAIAGCVGGSRGEEITVDYRQAVALSGVHVPPRGAS